MSYYIMYRGPDSRVALSTKKIIDWEIGESPGNTIH